MKTLNKIITFAILICGIWSKAETFSCDKKDYRWTDERYFLEVVYDAYPSED